MNDRPVIIVGVDDSPTSRSALSWALIDARRLSAAVEAVTTYPAAEGEAARERAQAVQDSLVAEAVGRLADPVPPVASLVMAGDPVDVLTLLSGHAYVLVMGRHSTVGLRHSAESSTAERVARLAECPVTIVPGSPTVPEHDEIAAAMSTD
jgi:nucleotide-binding universal stress UspA family protein